MFKTLLRFFLNILQDRLQNETKKIVIVTIIITEERSQNK